MKTQDTNETFLLTLGRKKKMPKVPVHLRERVLGMLQGGMRTADEGNKLQCPYCETPKTALPGDRTER